MVRSNLNLLYGGLLWWTLIFAEGEEGTHVRRSKPNKFVAIYTARPQGLLLRELPSLLSSKLSDPEGTWEQRPIVEMSHPQEDATISSALLLNTPNHIIAPTPAR